MHVVMKAILFSLFFIGSAHAQLRYNDVIQKSSHNSYNKDEGLMDQLVFHRLRSIEFDIRNTKIGQSTRNDDWFVYHIPVVDTKTNCNRLSECELAKRYLSEDDFVKPSDLLAACPQASNLRQAVTGNCDWPSLESIKGKWIFILVGGGNDYRQRSNRLGFTPSGASQNSDVNNSSSSVSGKVHHIATDKINYLQDPWARTHNENGWPFKCINRNCNDQASDENVITIKVNSEDIWGRRDHFHFLYQDHNTQNSRWTSSLGFTRWCALDAARQPPVF